MAWASRSDEDRVALKDYVNSHAVALEASQGVPGMDVSIDLERVRVAFEKRQRYAKEATEKSAGSVAALGD